MSYSNTHVLCNIIVSWVGGFEGSPPHPGELRPRKEETGGIPVPNAAVFREGRGSGHEALDPLHALLLGACAHALENRSSNSVYECVCIYIYIHTCICIYIYIYIYIERERL